MNPEFSPELRRELLDDFYAECDELLTLLREGLAALEGLAKEQRTDPALLEALFRHTHSLKGISAIVGLRPAEQLAHGMEDLLRAITAKEAVLSVALVDTLLAGAQRLEKIVAAHRLGKGLPEMKDLLGQLRQYQPIKKKETRKGAAGADSAEPASPVLDAVAEAVANAQPVFTAAFTPSPALDQRGVNVTSVRKRLEAAGRILKASPSVRGKGLIAFEFIVAFRAAPEDAEAWREDGVVLAPYQPGQEGKPATPGLTEPTMAETLSLTPSHLVRVDLARLDELMRITGELVMHRLRLEDRLEQLPAAREDLKEVTLALGRSLREMRAAISRVRMVPIADLFARMPFVVRDLARGSEKRARVVIDGNQIEVDKFVVERLKEPLLHLVRNAFAHGIEPVAEREAAGKPGEATLTLQARTVGEFVVIQVHDDGRGIDAERVALRARGLGIAAPEKPNSDVLLDILCTPGFSTREAADRAAGRGVGMAVVANTVRELGGRITLETSRALGTRFTLSLPLTLSIADAIIVTIGAQICAVPQSAVEEIVQIATDQIRTIRNTEVIPYRDGLLPLVRLAPFFRTEAKANGHATVLVATSERGVIGLLVDSVRTQREIVVRPLTDPLLRVRGISGATELGDGRPILILDANALSQGVVRPVSNADPAGRNDGNARALP